MHRLPSNIIFLKMLRLKCQFENFAKVIIILLFTHTYYLLNDKSMIIPNFGKGLYRDFTLITRNVYLSYALHPEGGVTQNDFDNWNRMSQIKTLFSYLGFSKRIVSNWLANNLSWDRTCIFLFSFTLLGMSAEFLARNV